MLIGLTGGIASGKSGISSLLKSRGAFIIDADKIARDVVEPHKKAWEEIVRVWGEDVLLSDLRINRSRLGSLVFGNKEELARLNNITHPEIIREIKERALENKDAPIVVVDAPLLIEAGLSSLVEEIWLVSIERENQIKRLIARDNISEKEAVKRIDSQMPLEEKKKYAHIIIDNNGSRADTEKFVDGLLQRYNL